MSDIKSLSVSEYGMVELNEYDFDPPIITKIERFEKAGEMAMVGWFHVFGKDGILLMDVQEKYVKVVTYKQDGDA